MEIQYAGEEKCKKCANTGEARICTRPTIIFRGGSGTLGKVTPPRLRISPPMTKT